MGRSNPHVSFDPETEDELRLARALDAMAGVEFMLESLPPGTTVPADQLLALVQLANNAARDFILWEPQPPAANDNG